jgi:hypothetical protein
MPRDADIERNANPKALRHADVRHVRRVEKLEVTEARVQAPHPIATLDPHLSVELDRTCHLLFAIDPKELVDRGHHHG